MMLFEEEDPLKLRYVELLQVEEERRKALKNMELRQEKTKRSFDKRDKPRAFKEGDLVLKWDVLKRRQGQHNKYDKFWSGPFVITACKEKNAFQLSTSDGEVMHILVNGIHLKSLFKG